jgi:hypothetical protein
MLSAFALALVTPRAGAEILRIAKADVVEVSVEKPAGIAIGMSAGDSTLVMLEKDPRFLSGVEFEITAPAAWISHHGQLAAAFYCALDRLPTGYASEIQVKEIRYEPLPNKIQSIYQIPVKQGAALRPSPYVSVLRETVPPDNDSRRMFALVIIFPDSRIFGELVFQPDNIFCFRCFVFVGMNKRQDNFPRFLFMLIVQADGKRFLTGVRAGLRLFRPFFYAGGEFVEVPRLAFKSGSFIIGH